jgi:hypothetical protein
MGPYGVALRPNDVICMNNCCKIKFGYLWVLLEDDEDFGYTKKTFR